MLKRVMLIIGVLAVVVTGAIGTALYVYTSAPCSFDQKYATQKVEKYLSDKHLPLEFLTFEPENSKECKFSYSYQGAGNKITFVVIDDFVKGAKLTYWDHVNREN